MRRLPGFMRIGWGEVLDPDDDTASPADRVCDTVDVSDYSLADRAARLLTFIHEIVLHIDDDECCLFGLEGFLRMFAAHAGDHRIDIFLRHFEFVRHDPAPDYPCCLAG
jgi:hypothetical protein